MDFAVEQCYPDIEYRVAGLYPPFFTLRMSCRSTVSLTTFYRVTQTRSILAATLIRIAHSVLAVATGLLDMVAMAFRFAVEGVPQQDKDFHRVRGRFRPVVQHIEHDPMSSSLLHHNTIWCVSRFYSIRSVGF